MIATGSNEVRQVFVGDGQVHGEITYEYRKYCFLSLSYST